MRALSVLVLTLPLSAFAQATPQEKAAAEALFDAGRALLQEGKHAEACAKLEQSQRIDPGIGTLLYLGDCYEKLGKLASAWATFREGASQARAAGQLDRARAGEDRAQKLAPRLSKLTIQVADENSKLEGFTIKRGDRVIERSLWGVPVPVDPGQHPIVASAPGRQTWSESVRVDGEGKAVAISVPALGPGESSEPPPEPPPAVPAAPPPPPSPEPPPAEPATDGSTQRTLGLIVGGAGVVAIGVGAVFGLRAISKNSDAESFCSGSRCSDPEGVELTQDAKDAATISNVAFGLGAVALIGGAALYFTAAPDAPEKALRVAPFVGQKSGGVWLGGRF